MGWDGTYIRNATHDDVKRIIREECTPGLVDMAHGFGQSWVLWKSEKTGSVVPMCVLWTKNKTEVRTKIMDLTMHPYYYRCPVRFLELMTPDIFAASGAIDWFRVWVKDRKPTKRVVVLRERFGVFA